MELPYQLVDDGKDREECWMTNVILENEQKEEILELMKTPTNVRKALDDKLGITDDQIDQINEVMMQHDCAFKEIIESDNVNILHGNDLLNNMYVCGRFVNNSPMTISELAASIKAITHGNRDKVLNMITLANRKTNLLNLK